MEEGPHGDGTPPSLDGRHGDPARLAMEATVRVVDDFRLQFRRDRAAGRIRSVSEYALRFPGHEDLIREDYRRLREEEPPVRLSASHLEVLERLAQFGTRRLDLSREVARGGMGVIYRVRDPNLGRDLALKTSDDARLPRGGVGAGDRAAKVRRMLQEAQITAQLSHPGVVPVHEIGLDREGRLFFTMKLVQGRTLRDIFLLVAEGREGWTLNRALHVFLRVCETMAFAHSKGVIHRDLKPANVMVGTWGEVYVMDWGVARVMDDPAAEDHLSVATTTPADPDAPEPVPLTRAGDVVGTPEYMPPEQAAGRVYLMDQRADVYSLGAMLYELLSRRAPYDDPSTPRTPVRILQSVLKGPPAPLSSLGSRVPAALQAICEKAMRRDPGDRYDSADELAKDLGRFLDGRVVLAHRTGPLMELRSWVRRNTLVAATVAASTALLVGGALLFAAERGRTAAAVRTERDTARNAEKRERAAHERAVGLLLAARADDLAEKEPAVALQLAVEAERRAPGPEATDALQAALALHHERRRLIGHDGYVDDGAWSPDGRTILTRESGTAAILWDAATGRIRRRLLATKDTTDAAFSPDGSTVAVSSEDGEVRLYASPEGEPAGVLHGSGAPVTAIAWRPGGDLLATGSADGTLDFRHHPPEGVRTVLVPGGPAVLAIAFSPDGELLAALDAAGGIRVWRTETMEAVASASVDRPEEPPASWVPRNAGLVFAGGGRLLGAWHYPSNCRLFSLEDGALRILADHADASVMAVSGDGRRLAIPVNRSEKERMLEVWDAERAEVLRTIPLDRGYPVVALDRTGERVALTEGNEVALLDLEEGRFYAVLRGHRYGVKACAWSPGGRRLLTCSADMTAAVWDPELPDTVRLPPGVETAALSPDGSRYFRVRDRADGGGREVAIVEAHRGGGEVAWRADPAPDSLAWTRDGRRLRAVTGDRIGILDPETGREVLGASLPSAAGQKAWDIQLSGDLSVAAVRDGKDWIAVLRLADPGTPPVRIEAKCHGYDLSADGRRLVGAQGSRYTAQVWDTATGAVVHTLTGHTGWVLRCAFSPDGRRIATSAVEGRVRVWDADSGAPVAVVAPVPMRSNPVVFGAGDGRLYVTTGPEVLVCDRESGAVLATLRTDTEKGVPVWDIPSPDGTALFVADDSHRQVRLWPLDPLAAARERTPIETEPLAARNFHLLEGDALLQYEESWTRAHPTGRGFANRALEEARRGRLAEALSWIEAARVLRPLLPEVAWAEACVRARGVDRLPPGVDREREITLAFEALGRALPTAMDVKDRALKEPLLTALRGDPRWDALVGR